MVRKSTATALAKTRLLQTPQAIVCASRQVTLPARFSLHHTVFFMTTAAPAGLGPTTSASSEQRS